MFYISQSLTDRLSMEAFYQLEWDQTVADNCGTFFAVDVVQDGCDTNYHVASPAIAPLQPIAEAFGQGFDVTSEGVVLLAPATAMLVIRGSSVLHCAGWVMPPSMAPIS